MDAKRVGPAANSRIYHASCYAETTRDEVGARGGGGTQELTVLGKRKAEVSSLFSLLFLFCLCGFTGLLKT